MKRLCALVTALLLASCVYAQGRPPANPRIRLATTTSLRDSGLLDVLIPAFAAESGYRVDVTAVGSGAAIRLGRDGNADILLVHDRDAEAGFIAEGAGIDRRELMYNEFVVVGPASDPAGVAAARSASEAFAAIFRAGAPFVSRGDKSGTDAKEREVWRSAGLAPSGRIWYREAGQGMAQTLRMADELGGYTLVDHATWCALRGRLGLVALFRGDAVLRNPYAVIRVNPARRPGVNAEGARALEDWLMSARGQALIEAYELGGERCFRLYR